MTLMNTFIPATMSADLRKPTAYYPLIFKIGGESFRFGLHYDIAHRDLPQSSREWVVSDPESGRMVCRVLAHYKGCVVSSRGVKYQEARCFAIDSLETLVQRVGEKKIVEKIKATREACK